MMVLKKLMVFMIVLMAVCGIVTVDSACSDLMDRQGKLIPVVRRVDQEKISLSLFGQTAEVNMKILQENWHDFTFNITASLEYCVDEIKSLFTTEEKMERTPQEQKNYDANKMQTL